MIQQQPGCGPPAPVPILQWEKEFAVLLELWRRRKGDRRLLEIGSYHGGTLYHWLKNSTEDDEIVSVDSYAVGVDNRRLYGEWNTTLASLAVIEGNSNEMATAQEVLTYAPFDLVLIDAGHFLPEVTRDWDLYRPMVRRGGLLVLHDILTHPAWPSIEVGQLWEKIKDEYMTFEIVADRDAEWGGLGVVLL
jgi:predicted O-methyltransferase YrrM